MSAKVVASGVYETAFAELFDDAYKDINLRLNGILERQNERYLSAMTSYLGRKEKELKTVIDDLRHKADLNSYKDS